MIRLVFMLPLSLLLASCAAPQKDTSTLEALKGRTVKIERKSGFSGDISQAIKAYKDVIEADGASAYTSEAMRGIADMEMQQIEQRLAEDELAVIEVDSYDKAIEWYEKLLISYPTYPDKETVLYQLAKAYEESGQQDKALTTLARLARELPTSERVIEAYFRWGEIAFSMQNYVEAEKAYVEIVRQGSDVSFYEQALFKHGWSIYKQDRCDDALNSFFSVLDYKLGRNNPPGELATLEFISKDDMSLVNDTFRVINLCFSQMEETTSMEEYFAGRISHDYEFLIYKNLSDLYLKEKRPLDAARVLSAFGERMPQHPHAVILQGYAIEVFRTNGFGDLIIDAEKEFVSRYEYFDHYWQVNPHNNYQDYLIRTDKKVRQVMREQFEVILNDLSRFYHARAQKEESIAAYKEATAWYRLYLKYFPEDENSANMHFLLAEALFEDKQYVAAVQEYELAGYSFPGYEKSVEGAYAALITYGEQEKLLTGGEKHLWHKDLLKSSLRFARTYPNDPRAPQVLTRVAEDFFQEKRYEEALSIAQSVVERYAKVDDAIRQTVLTVIAHTQFELERFDIAELYYQELQRFVARDDELYNVIQDRLAAVIYKQAEILRAEGAILDAIEEFYRVIEFAPDSTTRPIAEYDIASAYVILDDWDTALSHLERFRDRYPGHSLQDSVREKIAVGYMRLSRPLEAALALEDIINTGVADSPEAQREALWRAAGLYEEAGNLNKAIDTYQKYADAFPTPLEPAVEAIYKISLNYKTQGMDNYYRIQQEKIVEMDRKGGAERTNRTRYLAAQSAFELTEPRYQRYAKIRLRAPVRKNMQLKNQAMKKALSAYNQVIELGVAEFVTAAAYRIAQMYVDFGEKLLDSERPQNLSPIELEQYEILLEEQAYPLEETAIELHEANLARTQSGLYDAWIKKSLGELAKLMPARYAKSERGVDAFETLQ